MMAHLPPLLCVFRVGHGSPPRPGAWKCNENAGEIVRDSYDPSVFQMDLGADCPYNTAYYEDDGAIWTGFFELPEGLKWAAGAADSKKYFTANGDANTAWAKPKERWVTESKTVGPNVLPRLREGVERFLITDINNPGGSAMAQSDIPVMMDVWGQSKKIGDTGTSNDDSPAAGVLSFNHLPGGTNVLYMDGHVRFLKYGSGYPARSMMKRHGATRSAIGRENITDGSMG